MGSGAGKNLSAHAHKNRRQLEDSPYGISPWYKACREGDANELITMLPLLTYDQLQRTELFANGSTPLHVASYRNHYAVVKLLLLCGCDRDNKNRMGLTAQQEAASSAIRTLFTEDQRDGSAKFRELATMLEDDQFAPFNTYVVGHTDLEQVYDAREIMKIYRSSGIQRAAMSHIFAEKAYKNLREIIDRCIPNDHSCRAKAVECLERKDAFGLIKLYTLETGFYRYLQKDHALFTASLMINLSDFRHRAYQGRSFRGVKMAYFDLLPWWWATKKSGRLIETHAFMSTSELESVARRFAFENPNPKNKVGVLFILDFLVACDTAIKLTEDEEKKIKGDITDFKGEKEVLVTPYTLFRVEAIRYDANVPSYEIHLIHVPITS